MNKIKCIIVVLLLPLMLCAQGHGLQVALRGGAGTWQSEGASGAWTPEAGLDVNYLVRWRVRPYTQLGLLTGVNAIYSSYRLNSDFSSQFTRQDYLGNAIEYTTSVSAEEQHRGMALALPVCFAFQTHGLALNIGPKLQWLALDNYHQTVTKADIDAYFPQYKVHVPNQPSTGQLQTPYSRSGHNASNLLQLLLAAELGYEWQVGNAYSRYNEQYIGVQLYANYSVWNWSNAATKPFLDVSAIQSEMGPQIDIRSIQQACSPLAYMSLGIRLYYLIQTVDYHSHDWHRYRR